MSFITFHDNIPGTQFQITRNVKSTKHLPQNTKNKIIDNSFLAQWNEIEKCILIIIFNKLKSSKYEFSLFFI